MWQNATQPNYIALSRSLQQLIKSRPNSNHVARQRAHHPIRVRARRFHPAIFRPPQRPPEHRAQPSRRRNRRLDARSTVGGSQPRRARKPRAAPPRLRETRLRYSDGPMRRATLRSSLASPRVREAKASARAPRASAPVSQAKARVAQRQRALWMATGHLSGQQIGDENRALRRRKRRHAIGIAQQRDGLKAVTVG